VRLPSNIYISEKLHVFVSQAVPCNPLAAREARCELTCNVHVLKNKLVVQFTLIASTGSSWPSYAPCRTSIRVLFGKRAGLSSLPGMRGSIERSSDLSENLAQSHVAQGQCATAAGILL
jgi:hypothetical protein